MSYIDWAVLLLTLIVIVAVGVYKSWKNKNIQGYLLADRSMPWYTVGISVMATQASAITFLSAPGQAYTDGMGFVQFYFGLPIAIIILCITFVPIYHRLKVYTAYEFLEDRFDLKTRAFTSFLFLIQRALSTGITVYAPSLVLSSILGWNITYTTTVIGFLVIIYTVVGGSKAVSYTQMQQMAVIFLGMFIAGILLVKLLPEQMTFTDALHVAGKMGKLELLDFSFDPKDKYNFWSGLIGGTFLALSYFGTDQSQVGRYLSGETIKQSRLGLLMNGLIKIPMQFLILLIGVLLFTFYQFNQAPVFFNKAEIEKVEKGPYAEEFRNLEYQYKEVNHSKALAMGELAKAQKMNDPIAVERAYAAAGVADLNSKKIRNSAIETIKANDPDADTNDTNYVFLSFVIGFLPVGVIGLLIAVIFSASMSSTASALNALTSTSVVDIYKRLWVKQGTANHYVFVSKVFTLLWGVFIIGVAQYANKVGSLIEYVNILGSLFYGTILGIFLVAFYVKKVSGATAFYAAIITEAIVIGCYYADVVAYLWLNVIGALLVIVISLLMEYIGTHSRKYKKLFTHK